MFRMFAVIVALVCAAPAFAQPLPAGLDPQNTILLDTKYGRVVIKLRPDIAPKHAERIKLLAREKFYDNVPFHRVIDGFMAPNSQFFIMFTDYPSLNGQYTVIGEVVSGMPIVDKIKKGEPVTDPDLIIRMQVAADAK